MDNVQKHKQDGVLDKNRMMVNVQKYKQDGVLDKNRMMVNVQKHKQDGVLDKNRMMVNVQKHNICSDVPSSQTFRSYLHLYNFGSFDDPTYSKFKNSVKWPETDILCYFESFAEHRYRYLEAHLLNHSECHEIIISKLIN
jgi:hypothetical protein